MILSTGIQHFLLFHLLANSSVDFYARSHLQFALEGIEDQARLFLHGLDPDL